ncbi:MAG: LamG domain-containing protein [Planctomycetota bacterium]
MSKNSILLGAFGLLLVMVTLLQAQPLVQYTFDDGTPGDASGNGLDGALLGNAEIVADPERGQVLEINESGMQVDGPFEIATSFTLSAWVKLDVPRTGRYYFGGPWWIRTDNQEGSEHHWCEIRYPGGAFVDKFDTRTQDNPDGQLDGQWHHIAVVLPDDGAVKAYVDGALAPVRDNSTKEHDFAGAVGPLFFGTQDEGGANAISGYMDDIQVFNYAVGEDEIPVLMEGVVRDYPSARKPSPADGALHPETWVNLSWSPGDSAVTHDVYLGDNFEDVDSGTGDTFRANQSETLFIAGFPGFAFPEGLVPGTTYYWRIDEVNDSEPNSPWKGDVWSFSIPPRTAYNPDPAEGAEFVDPDVILTWTGGFGAKLHHVYVGDSFSDVNDGTGDTYKGPTGTARLAPGTLEEEKVYYWRVDEFDGLTTYKGDVWGFTTPGAVGNPQPANGAKDVPMTTTLSWAAADNAASHELYFGTGRDAVKNATTASPQYIGARALGSEVYDPGKLNWNTPYYWRVDEVYPTETVKGLVWSFTIADFILVDDFESYNDIDPPDDASNRIFDNWIDGFGTTTNGALVGNDLPPYAEQNIVHGGAQSMIYRYDNSGKTSEATLTLLYPRDWAEQDVTKLTLWVRGSTANAADRMFIALDGTAVVYHDDASATQLSGWNEWVIELAAFGVDLTNVNSITIGVGTKNAPVPDGGTGTLYFDDIRLYR